MENEKPHICALPQRNCNKTPQSLAEHMWCFFYLLKITTIAIIKANAIIVTPTKLQKSKYIVNSIACSTIQHHLHSHSKNCVYKVATLTSAFFHFLCFRLYNIFYLKTSEHTKILQIIFSHLITFKNIFCNIFITFESIFNFYNL